MAPVQFARPDATVMFDFRQEDARAQRLALTARAVKAVKVDLLIGAVHLPFPAIGKLRRAEVGGCAYEPLPWQLY